MTIPPPGPLLSFHGVCKKGFLEDLIEWRASGAVCHRELAGQLKAVRFCRHALLPGNGHGPRSIKPAGGTIQ